jgi:hypothetical protein
LGQHRSRVRTLKTRRSRRRIALKIEYTRSRHIGVVADGTVCSPSRLHYTLGCATGSDDVWIKNLHEIFVIKGSTTQSPGKGFPLLRVSTCLTKLYAAGSCERCPITLPPSIPSRPCKEMYYLYMRSPCLLSSRHRPRDRIIHKLGVLTQTAP